LCENNIRFQTARSNARRVGRYRAEPTELAAIYTQHWQQLNALPMLRTIDTAEREMADFRKPAYFALSITASMWFWPLVCGRSGPIEHYASARALNGRAGCTLRVPKMK
jgi:hypothetical protein